MKTISYIIKQRCLPFVKIGQTRDLKTRLSTLQTASPTELEVLLTTPIDEGALHRFFAPCRTRGEWFVYNQDFQRLFNGLMALHNHFVDTEYKKELSADTYEYQPGSIKPISLDALPW